MKKNMILLALMAMVASGCQNDTAKQDTPAAQPTEQTAQAAYEQPAEQAAQTDPHDLKALATALGADELADTPAVKPITTADGKIQIDWSHIDTKVAAIKPSQYSYPFAPDSQPVQNYAKAYNISAEQAQYAMMLSMASPEALGKILDQISDQYVSHEFQDGDSPTLIVHTDANVVAEQHQYVLADKFGEGLILPIEIRPKSASAK